MARPANSSPQHVSRMERWEKLARDANPNLDPTQVRRLAEMMKTEHFRKMQAASVAARRATKQLAELAAQTPDERGDGDG